MSTLNPTDQPDLADMQHQVTYKLGQLLIMLQHYERLFKSLVAESDISGTLDTIPKHQKQNAKVLKKKSLGTVVEGQGKAFFRSDDFEEEPDPELVNDVPHFRLRMGMQFDPEDLIRIRKEQKKLVTTRNALVHKFIGQFDMRTADGCRAAIEHLDSNHQLISAALTQLKQWTETSRQARVHMAGFINSEQFECFLTTALTPPTDAKDDTA